MFKSFKEMPVWQEAMSIAEEIFHITDSLPRKDKINFYSFARGSLTETQNHLEYAKRVGYIEEKVHQRIDEHLDVLHKDLNKIMLTLKSQSRSKP
jgi:hypothetical protein